MIRRYVKNFLFNFLAINKRKNINSKVVLVFENGASSDYFSWLSNVVPEHIDIIELKKNFSLTGFEYISNRIILKNMFFLKYDYIFFHSPGEVLQKKLINFLKSVDYQGQIIGFQHGLIGLDPPDSLQKIIKSASYDWYISVEESFSEILRNNNIGRIYEMLIQKPLYKYPINYPSLFGCYLDAFDKAGAIKKIIVLKSFLKKNKIKLTSIKYHPSTNILFKSLVYVYLKKHLVYKKNHNLNCVICWDSKVKYELMKKNIEIYTFDTENNFCFLDKDTMNKEYDFNNHIKETFLSFESEYLNSVYL